jgi:DNA-binding IclR family transcriptional regulator
MRELADRAAVVVAPGDRGVEQTLGRAAALLDALAGARENGLRFTDLVTATGFSKATVHRLLAGLSAHRFVETDPGTGRLFLGFRLAGWGAATRGRHGLVERAAPILRDLADRLGDTVYLILRDGPIAICVARYEGSFPIRALPLTPGDRNALGVGSGSLALLAFLADDDIERILRDPENVSARERRGIAEDEVRRLIGVARRRGYAITERLTPGMTGVGLPVPSSAGAPMIAVSVATISARMRQPRLKEVISHLGEAARAIANVAGGANGISAQSSRSLSLKGV